MSVTDSPVDVKALVERLRAVDHMSVEDCFLQSPLFAQAADALLSAQEEAAGLRVERDRLLEKGLNLIEERNRAESKLADAVGVLEQQDAALADADEELRMIRRKDCWVVYDTLLRSFKIPLARQAARAFLTSIKETGDAR